MVLTYVAKVLIQVWLVLEVGSHVQSILMSPKVRLGSSLALRARSWAGSAMRVVALVQNILDDPARLVQAGHAPQIAVHAAGRVGLNPFRRLCSISLSTARIPAQTPLPGSSEWRAQVHA